MPYTKMRRGELYCIMNKKTKKVTCYRSAEDREKGIRIKEAFAHGWVPSHGWSRGRNGTHPGYYR